jgi:hypothetical protein
MKTNFTDYLKTYEAIIAAERIKGDIYLSNKSLRTLDNLFPYEQSLLKLFKFKIGDYVKLRDNIYKIMAVDTEGAKASGDFRSKYHTYYLYNLDKTSYGWVIEHNLKLAEDFEIDAMKYNL